MQDRVGIAVSDQTLGMIDLNAAYDQPSPLDQAVNVISHPNADRTTHFSNPYCCRDLGVAPP
jgi:hypothetical protein